MEKRCFKCGETKELAAFYRHPRMADGHLNKCKECTKKYMADRLVKSREAIQEYDRDRSKSQARKAAVIETQRKRRERHPEKNSAYLKVKRAIRSGALTIKPCEVCGTTERVQAHHDDYSLPLDVRWLCFKHHREHHGQVVISV